MSHCLLKSSAVTAAVALALAATTLPAQRPHKPEPPKGPWMDASLPPEQRADMVLKQMTLDEKIDMLHGNGMAHADQWQMPLTFQMNGGAGLVVGVPRLGIPAIIMSDAAYGVRSSGENGRYSTALPSNFASANSWDTNSACEYGELIGRELRNQGFTMTLGGGVNLTREPRNGRTFEYMGEDPLLAGTLVGHRIKCEQAQHVIGDIKHYALNDQETGRNIVDARISRRALQESDLLAFHIGINIGHPAAVMCSYNRINGDYACENTYTLHDVLKGQWKFPGFVLSDWGGTHSTVKASAAGLDNEQPLDKYFGPALKTAVQQHKVPMAEIDDHVRRMLYGEFVSGIVDHPDGEVGTRYRSRYGNRAAHGREEHCSAQERAQCTAADAEGAHHCVDRRTRGRRHDLRRRIGAGGPGGRQRRTGKRQDELVLAGACVLSDFAAEGPAGEDAGSTHHLHAGR